MRTTLERLPDGSDYVAVLHGPIVLAAKTGTEDLGGLIAGDGRMAHIAPGPYEPLDQAPMLVGDFGSLAGHIKPVPGKPLTFTAPDIIRPEKFKSLELVPFFRVHDARYEIYWPTVSAAEYPHVVAKLEEQEKNRLALETRTLDQVIPGEQQPEVEHNFKGEDSRTGVNLGRSWRDAGDWFSYDLKSVPGEPVELQITYFAGERRRNFDILVNGTRIATERLNGGNADQFVEKRYSIPEEVTNAATNGVLTVKFEARDRSRAGGIYGVRLLRK